MKKFLKAVLIIVTVGLLLFYIPAIFIYQISPAQFWPIGIIGIGFFYLFIALLTCTICWIFFSWKKSGLLLILLLAGIPVLKNVWAFHMPVSFHVAKKAGSCRVMQWNCEGLPGASGYLPIWLEQRKTAVEFIQKFKPDIICLQDFSETEGQDMNSNIALLRDSLGYAHFIFGRHYYMRRSWGNTWWGVAIFSKYPLVDTGTLTYTGKDNPESIVWADLAIDNKKLRVSSTHFQSMHLTHTFETSPLDTAFWQDSSVIIHGNTLSKIRFFQSYHVRQAAVLNNFIQSNTSAFILGADLNSVPSSYVYKQVKGNLSDAFLEKGSGLGRSYQSRQPALRIDYLFHSKQVKILQFGLFRPNVSDHDPLLMDFELR